MNQNRNIRGTRWKFKNQNQNKTKRWSEKVMTTKNVGYFMKF